MSDTVYVSITGLRLKRWWHIAPFLYHALRATRQARKSEGNLEVQLTKVAGVYHTLTVWRSQEDMRRFIYSGAHLAAIRAFPKFATGKTFDFEAPAAPALAEVHALWQRYAKAYQEG